MDRPDYYKTMATLVREVNVLDDDQAQELARALERAAAIEDPNPTSPLAG